MVFSDANFVFLFLPLTLLVYYLPFLKKNMAVRNVWLLLVSLGFYAWGEPLYVFLMIVSILMNYIFGRLVSECPASPKGKRIVALACVCNLGILFVFKYLNWILGLFGFAGDTLLADLALPIGISFYTFQALSYVIDVYRGRDEAQKSVINVGLYIAFFPQLIAGPIVRYGSIAEQLKEREHSLDKFSEGVWRFSIGLSKKLLLANQLAVVADIAFEHAGNGMSVLMAWAGALGFMLQIYFDFSGYSDMAIGLGKMFGFTFLENFRYPYISTSITEYWRRWHISLGEWFRDYVYYPLSFGPAVRLRRKLVGMGMKRKTSAVLISAFVLFVTWMATGLWHGANVTFVVWGLIQFVCIFLEQYRKPAKNEKLGKVVGFITTFFIVLCTKVIFKAESMGQALLYYRDMLHLSGNAAVDDLAVYWLGQYKVIFALGILFAFPVMEKIGELVKGKAAEKAWELFKMAAMVCLLAGCLAYAIGGAYNPFIYFNF